MVFRVPFPALSPLQSRVAASFLATAIVITIWIIATLPSTAYSQGLGNRRMQHPHPHHPIHYAHVDSKDANDIQAHDGGGGSFTGIQEQLFSPQFPSAGHEADEQSQWASVDTPDSSSSDDEHEPIAGLEKRDDEFVNPLNINQPTDLNIISGKTQLWKLDVLQVYSNTGDKETPGEFIDEENNVKMRTVYFTFNTCLRPRKENGTTIPAPALTLYASNSSSNRSPGPDANPKQQLVIPFVEGFANLTVNVTSDVYFSITAPNTTNLVGNYSGDYNYQVIASNKGPYSGYYKSQHLYLIDSDSTAALLISGNETQYPKNVNISSITPPYTFFAYPSNSTDLVGLRRSWCGMKNGVKGKAIVGDISMTRRGLGNRMKQQIYLRNLEPSTTYDVWLAKQNNETEGGWIWPAMNLTTKSDGNCKVVYDLEFCSEVAYAVPTNNTIFQSMSFLAKFYDTYASSWYSNFSYSLQQVQCNTTADRQYSHLRSCDDCAAAYKTWLCATTIPRCADFSNTAGFLAKREREGGIKGPTKSFLEDGRIVEIPLLGGNTTEESDSETNEQDNIRGSSRNSLIDEVVSPGPYKEIKPCMDLCWSLVQSCPASFGFNCPSGRRGDHSYGWRSDDGDITCSYLGAAYFLSMGNGLDVGWFMMIVGVFVAMVGVVL